MPASRQRAGSSSAPGAGAAASSSALRRAAPPQSSPSAPSDAAALPTAAARAASPRAAAAAAASAAATLAQLPRAIAEDRFSPYFLLRLRSWLRRHGVGSFWLPILLLLAAASPWPRWFLVHGLLMAGFSLLAHLTYRTLDPSNASAATRRGRAPTSLALHALRLAAGLGRWVFMPLAFLHATCNYPAHTHGPEPFAHARAWNLDMPLVDGPKLVARLARALALARALPRAPWALPLPLPSVSTSAGEGSSSSVTLTLGLTWHAHACHPAFVLLLALFAGARALQLALWLAAAPPLRRDSKLRVLIVGDSIPPKVDGVAVRVGHLVPSLLQRGHEVHIVNSIRAAPLGAAGVTQLGGFESALYRGHSITLPNPLGVLGVILRFRPHVIHIMDESFLQASAQVAASVCLIPTVWSHHSRLDKFAQAYLPFLSYLPSGLSLFLLQILRRTFASGSDVHLSVGDDMAFQLEQAGCGPDISHWACGVDSAVFNPSRAQLSVAPGSLRAKLTAGRASSPIVLYCGRVAPEKRLELVPAVALALLERYKREGGGSGGSSGGSGGSSSSSSSSSSSRRGAGAAAGGGGGAPPAALSFVIIGDGPALAEVKRLMAEVGPTWELRLLPGGGGGGSGGGGGEDAGAGAWGEPTPLSSAPGASRGAVTTTFLGQVSHCPALGTVYATSDAFFSPSTCETLGQVFQESMASGLVPTGCRFGGVPEVFDHGAEGYLFEPEDTAGAAAGIARALGDRAASLAASGGGACPVAIPAAWAAAGAPGRGEAARARVLSKSWAAAYAQAESAYYRALATRWPYLPNKPLRR